jgi:hypothetical protein
LCPPLSAGRRFLKKAQPLALCEPRALFVTEQPGMGVPECRRVPKWNRPVCYLRVERLEKRTLSAGLLPDQAASAAELPATRFWNGPGLGLCIRRSGACGSNKSSARGRTGISLHCRRLWGGRPRFGGGPITGVIDGPAHLLKPPICPSRTAPAPSRRFKPRLVLKSQLQLPTDHNPPLSSSQGGIKEQALRQA